jgi:hypothetical protein
MDEGLDFSVQTILCRDCKKLYDAVIRLRFSGQPKAATRSSRKLLLEKPVTPDDPPAFDAVLNRLPIPAKRSHWMEFKIRCPIAPIHRVQPWSDPGKCPRCGVYLERAALPFRVWE